MKENSFLNRLSAALLVFALVLNTVLNANVRMTALADNPLSEEISVYMTLEGDDFYIEPVEIILPVGATVKDATIRLLEQAPSFDSTQLSDYWIISINHGTLSTDIETHLVNDQDVIRWQLSTQYVENAADKTALIRVLFTDERSDLLRQEVLHVMRNPLATETEVATLLAAIQVSTVELDQVPDEEIEAIPDEIPTEYPIKEPIEEIEEIPLEVPNEERIEPLDETQEFDEADVEVLEAERNEALDLYLDDMLDEVLNHHPVPLDTDLEGSLSAQQTHESMIGLDVSNELQQTLDLLVQLTPTPEFAVIGGEWTILPLSRGNHPVPDDYFEGYLGRIHHMVTEAEGILHHIRRTDYARLIVALNALGENVTDVAGYDLTARILSLSDIVGQGINGPIWALIALSTVDFEDIEELEEIQQQYIEFILSRELENGGWALAGNHADPDMTAMALYALAPHAGDHPEIQLAIDRALTRLSEIQLANGGFMSWGTENSQSNSQVIIALTTLGIDPVTDSRFVINGHNPLTALLTFSVSGGGFRHIHTGQLDGMATEQGAMALVAYDRFVSGENPLFDMRDVNLELGDPTVPQPIPDPEPDPTPDPEPTPTAPVPDNASQEDDTDLTDDETDEGEEVSNDEDSEERPNNKVNRINRVIERSVLRSNRATEHHPDDALTLTTLEIREVFRGDGVDLIPDDKRAVAVLITDIPERTRLVFKEETNLYFSEEMTDVYGQPTYLLMVDIDISDEDLMDPANYVIVADQEAVDIIFGDTSGSGMINAQDALNVITAGTREGAPIMDREILTMNVNFDSRVDLSDALVIMERFISHQGFIIFEDEARDEME